MSRWRIRNGSRETVRDLFFRKATSERTANAALTRLRQFLDGRVPALAQALVRFWQDQQQATSFSEIRHWIESDAAFLDAIAELRGDYERLCSTGMLAAAWQEAAKAGTNATDIYVGNIQRKRGVTKGEVRKDNFDPYEDEIPEWIRIRGAELVVEITEGQRSSIREAILQGYKMDMGAAQIAAAIRPMIGLTLQQVRANLNYYANYFETLAQNNPYLSNSELNRRAQAAADRYATRQLRYRAESIAITEMAYAYNRGGYEAMKRAQAEGRVGVLEKRWSTADDERTCQICEALNDTRVGIDADFDYPGTVKFEGQHLAPPAHPRCRCTLDYHEIAPPAREREDIFIDWTTSDRQITRQTTEPSILPNTGINGTMGSDNNSTGSIATNFNSRYSTEEDKLKTRYEQLSEINERYYMSRSDFASEEELRRWKEWRKTIDIYDIQDELIAIQVKRLRLARDTSRLRAINPNYKTGDIRWTNNCQRCVVAEELVNRGYRVRAKAYDASDPVKDNGLASWKFSSVHWTKDKDLHVTSRASFLDDAKAAFREWGDGARAVVRVEWENGSGHFFSAKNINGTIVYTDPQSGKVRDIVDTLDLCTSKTDRLWIMRVDNRDVSDLVDYAVEEIT